MKKEKQCLDDARYIFIDFEPNDERNIIKPVRYSTDRKSILVPTRKNTKYETAKEFNVIILGHNGLNIYGRDAQSPRCISDDGKYGRGNPGGSCMTCSYGSTAGNGLCQNCSCLFVIRERTIMPAMMMLNGESMKNFMQYFFNLRNNGKKMNSVLTKIKLNTSGSCSLNFSFVKELEDGEWIKLMNLKGTTDFNRYFFFNQIFIVCSEKGEITENYKNCLKRFISNDVILL